jgi:hypothetical protein
MRQLNIPTIEEIIDSNAYGSRMHFLKPTGEYYTQPGIVPKPHILATDTEAAAYSDDFLMWIDYQEYRVLNQIESPTGDKYSVTSRNVGSLALRTDLYAAEFDDIHDIECFRDVPSAVQLWLAHYATNTSHHSDGRLRHPLPHELYQLYENMRLNCSEVPAELSARIANTALANFPEQKPWIQRMKVSTKPTLTTWQPIA